MKYIYTYIGIIKFSIINKPPDNIEVYMFKNSRDCNFIITDHKWFKPMKGS